jgi:hypothetical protein
MHSFELQALEIDRQIAERARTADLRPGDNDTQEIFAKQALFNAILLTKVNSHRANLTRSGPRSRGNARLARVWPIFKRMDARQRRASPTNRFNRWE